MASHKHAKNGLLARTTSSATDVLQMAEAVATSQQTDWFRGLGPLTVTNRGASAMEFTVLGGLGGKYKQIVFTVSTGTDASTTTVRTAISFYRTSQNTIMGFIPAGPKLMNNYSTYKLFLERLSATLKDSDANASIVISDTADSDPVPPAYSPARD
ncbi:hypothetical protein [uncultured Amnibacterium sp.]|uniref:hypothetical protein n=1 Tax=uncultured Amnibacterium sp. TaxID=1631851 RepID=UPI0035CA3E8E